MGPAGEHGERNGVSHAEGGLVSVGGHGLDDELRVLDAVPESSLHLQGLLSGHSALAQKVELLAVEVLDILGPLGIRLLRGGPLGNVDVRGAGSLPHVDAEHLSRAEASLGHDIGGALKDVPENSHLRGHVDVSVRGLPEPGRPKPVPVEPGADLVSVAEHEKGWAVPSLLQALVILVKGLDLRVLVVQVRVVVVGLRHEEHHGGLHVELGLGQELGNAVEVGRVARALSLADGEEVLLVSLPQRVVKQLLPAVHDVQVALQRVDLAVVPEEPHGLGEGPLGHRVRGESPVVDAKRSLEELVLQVQKVALHHR
mmetsp:Transcript_6751/g.24330  ORF Transcript_6751/g.24330 Transcript_6751/m.24330 type:complete len:313 (-) Transcript_6751:914-1852(-)